MRNVIMPKSELISILEKNRAGHTALYEQAYKIFRGKLIENLSSMLDRAQNGDRVELWVGLPEPEDHTEDYDRALAMLNHDVRNDIELTQSEYAQFVQDDWGWKHTFASNTASYVTLEQ
jgi:hypothetical protein